MKFPLRSRILLVLLCVCLLMVTIPAKADTLQNAAILAGVTIGAIGAAIGIGVYYLVRRGDSMTGCAAANPDGVELRLEDNQPTYALIGDTAAIKIGDRIRVVGKKKKAETSGRRVFLVEKLGKNYGPCKTLPAVP